MKTFIKILQSCFFTLVMMSNILAFANDDKDEKFIFSAQKNAPKIILAQFTSIDLSRVLPYILKSGDQLQRFEKTVYKNKNALKLVLFNKKTGRVRYVFIDAKSGKILKD